MRRSVNGVLKTSTDADFLNSNGNAALRIRKGDDYGNNVIDDVAIYDAPLSAVQIAAHYLAGS